MLRRVIVLLLLVSVAHADTLQQALARHVFGYTVNWTPALPATVYLEWFDPTAWLATDPKVHQPYYTKTVSAPAPNTVVTVTEGVWYVRLTVVSLDSKTQSVAVLKFNYPSAPVFVKPMAPKSFRAI